MYHREGVGVEHEEPALMKLALLLITSVALYDYFSHV